MGTKSKRDYRFSDGMNGLTISASPSPPLILISKHQSLEAGVFNRSCSVLWDRCVKQIFFRPVFMRLHF